MRTGERLLKSESAPQGVAVRAKSLESGATVLSAVVLFEHRPATRLGLEPAEVLVRTLGSLVRANIDGLLRDVAIAGPEGEDLDAIADHAGCALVTAGSEPEWLHQAITIARGPDLLLLRSGCALDGGFVEEARDFLRSGGTSAQLRAAPETFLERLFPDMAPLAGLIAPRARCLDALPGRLDRLARSIGRARVLRSRARRIGV